MTRASKALGQVLKLSLDDALHPRQGLAVLGQVLKRSPDAALHLDLPISRQDIASIIGTRPETVARTIRGLGGDGVARFSGRPVTIHDLDALLDEVEQAA